MRKPRVSFSIDRAALLAAKMLPSDELRGRLFLGLAAFGLDCVEPEFTEPELLTAWHEIRPFLAKGWGLSDKGRLGGLTTQARKKAAQAAAKPASIFADIQPKSSTLPPPELLTLRESALEQTPKYKAYLRSYKLGRLLDNQSFAPLLPKQIRWLYDTFGGFYVLSLGRSLCAKGEYYFNHLRIAGKTTFQELIEMHLKQSEAFELWLASTFPKLGRQPEAKRLSLPQYTALCCKFGRYNVLCKMAELEGWKAYGSNATACKTIEAAIEKAVDKYCRYGEQTPHSMKPNDERSPELLGYPEGFDKDFSLPLCQQPLQ